MSIVKETVKDFRQATIRVIVAAILPTLGATSLLCLKSLKGLILANAAPEHLYYSASALLIFCVASSSFLVFLLWNIRSSKVGIVIISANYGSSHIQPDVTKAVKACLKKGRLNVIATTEALGVADPMEGRKKELVIVCKLMGENRTFYVPEGRRLILP